MGPATKPSSEIEIWQVTELMFLWTLARGGIHRSPADRRSFTVALTARGERAAARVHATFAALDERVLTDLSPSAAEGFHHVRCAIEHVTLFSPAARAAFLEPDLVALP